MAAGPDPSSVRLPGPWRHFDVRANGVKFHAVQAAESSGGDDRPLVLLLHGFGEFWWSWRNHITQLDAAGYRAVAVDLRGYGDSDKPPRGYDGWTLAGDTNGLVRALGHRTATLVGHADGGLVCWATATLHPRVVTSIAVIASPHPRALRHDVLLESRQRAAFLGGFLRNQLPRHAERHLTRNDGAFIADFFAARAADHWRRTDDYARTLEHNRAAVQIPGVAHCSLEYQRWAFRSQFRPDGLRFMELMDRPLHIPVLAIRGADDPFITDEAMAASTRWAPHLDYRRLANSAHFCHQENPEEVSGLLVDLLTRTADI
ncbi:MAG: alpha/beta hydrolase [Gordonia sp. (in: high G+C Gram-positive bacteria)]